MFINTLIHQESNDGALGLKMTHTILNKITDTRNISISRETKCRLNLKRHAIITKCSPMIIVFHGGEYKHLLQQNVTILSSWELNQIKQ